MDDDKKTRILLAVEKASGSTPMGYICVYCSAPAAPCDIDHPCELLNELEIEGYIKRCPPNSWSPSVNPQYEISSKGRQKLEAMLLQ